MTVSGQNILIAENFNSKVIDAAVRNWFVYSDTYDEGVEIP